MHIAIEPHAERSFNVVAHAGTTRIGFAFVHDLPRLGGGRVVMWGLAYAER